MNSLCGATRHARRDKQRSFPTLANRKLTAPHAARDATVLGYLSVSLA